MSIERKRIDDTLKRTGDMIGSIDRDRLRSNQSDQQLLVRIAIANNSLDVLMNRNLDDTQRETFARYKYWLSEIERMVKEGRR